MQTQRTITIFLASSEELINDRNSFQALIASLDDIYEERGIRIKCKRWEDFNAYCTGERTQDQYNRVVCASDVCICMFHRKAGKFTKEEFYHALNEYRQNNDHPKTYVYVRTLVEGEVEEEELKAFKVELFQTIGHYWCNYVTEDAMKLHFVMQLERMMTPAFSSMGLQPDNLKVENGNVLLYGRKIADFENLSFASCNTEYISLKKKIESLNKEISQFRAMGIAELRPVILAKSAERNQYQEDLMKLEEQLFQIALSVNKMTSSETPVSERKCMAIEMFEKGNIKGVIEVLNENDMAADAERAKADISRGKQLVEAGNEMVESGLQKVRALVDEYVMKAKTLMVDFTESNRFQLACQAYEQAIVLTSEHLTDGELSHKLFEIASFLCKNNAFDKAEVYCLDCLEVRRRLACEKPQNFESSVADILNNLALLYSDTQRFSESEKMLKEALEIRRHLAEKYIDSTTYISKSLIADTFNNLGHIYSKTQRFSECEKMHKEALEIRRRLAERYPLVYESKVAFSLNNLAVVYYKTCRFLDSEKMYKEAMEIHRRFAENNPGSYEQHVAETLHNLANLYLSVQRFFESENMYKEALATHRRLAMDSPQAFEPYVAETLNNLALLYFVTQRFSESENMYKEALAIRRRFAMDSPQAFEPCVAETIKNLASIYFVTQRFSESENMYKEALAIRRRLAMDSPQAFEPCVAETIKNLALLYSETQRFSESEDMYKEALAIHRRLADSNLQLYGSYVANILIRLALLYLETQCFSKSETAYKEALEIDRHLEDNNQKFSKSEVANIFCALAFNNIFICKYAKSEQYARNGLEIDSTNTLLYSNLAPSLLFQGKYDEAEQIYCRYKDELVETFLSDFEEFERANAIPREYEKDVERIRIMLTEGK